MNKYRPKYQKSLGSPFWKLLLLLLLLGALTLPFLSQCSFQEDDPTVTAQPPPPSVLSESNVPTTPTQASKPETLPGTEPTLFPPTELTAPTAETPPSEAVIESLPPEEPTEDLQPILETQPSETIVETQPHAHDYYVEFVLPPTCTEAGYTLRHCDCGEALQDDYISPLGHQYERSPAESEGFLQYVCTRCADTYQEKSPTEPVQAAEHVHEFLAVKTVAPNCTNVGYTLERCSCGLAQRSDLVPALNHQMEITVVAPDSGVQGYTLHQCSRCSFHFRSDIKAPLP